MTAPFKTVGDAAFDMIADAIVEQVESISCPDGEPAQRVDDVVNKLTALPYPRDVILVAMRLVLWSRHPGVAVSQFPEQLRKELIGLLRKRSWVAADFSGTPDLFLISHDIPPSGPTDSVTDGRDVGNVAPDIGNPLRDSGMGRA